MIHQSQRRILGRSVARTGQYVVELGKHQILACRFQVRPRIGYQPIGGGT